MMKKFLMCGAFGWCLEICWTALNSLRKKEMKLKGTTSLWMFPIYGCAALLSPVSKVIRRLPTLLRGSIYSALIMSTEYISGSFLTKKRMCPWDYSRAKLNYKGIIRLDYAIAWFFVGLMYEKVLKRS